MKSIRRLFGRGRKRFSSMRRNQLYRRSLIESRRHERKHCGEAHYRLPGPHRRKERHLEPISNSFVDGYVPIEGHCPSRL